MRFFFSSRQFKIILSVLLCLIAVSVVCFFVGGKISPQANILGTVAAPFRAVFTKISNSISDFTTAYTDGNEALIKNAELEKEIGELREKLADYDKLTAENKFYKEYLDIKDAHPDFKFAAATLISRDKNDPYGSFVINKGSNANIKQYDPVITDRGLVGYVSEVGINTSKVTTILSPDITLGAIDNRTNDSGVLSGTLALAEEGQTRFYNLSRSCNIAIGDYVVTSGEGIFPTGILVGTIQSIGSDEYNTSIFAAVKPFVQLDELREVMVITSFSGQGGLDPEKTK